MNLKFLFLFVLMCLLLSPSFAAFPLRTESAMLTNNSLAHEASLQNTFAKRYFKQDNPFRRHRHKIDNYSKLAGEFLLMGAGGILFGFLILNSFGPIAALLILGSGIIIFESFIFGIIGLIRKDKPIGYSWAAVGTMGAIGLLILFGAIIF